MSTSTDAPFDFLENLVVDGSEGELLSLNCPSSDCRRPNGVFGAIPGFAWRLAHLTESAGERVCQRHASAFIRTGVVGGEQAMLAGGFAGAHLALIGVALHDVAQQLLDVVTVAAERAGHARQDARHHRVLLRTHVVDGRIERFTH